MFLPQLGTLEVDFFLKQPLFFDKQKILLLAMKQFLSLLLITLNLKSFSQTTAAFSNENKIYQPNIKTVLCFNSNQEQSLPLIQLANTESLTFAFDDLLGGTKNYWYTITHCTSDWKTSPISTMDYLASFSEDRIINYRYSTNTTRKFTHYELSLPNAQIQPKISGNYILKVYLDNDVNKPVISQRFYVLENQVAVGAEVTNALQVADRNSAQKINFTINYNLQIANPYQDIKAVVMQNFNYNTAKINTKPAFIKPNQLIYNDINDNIFGGGNEFRKFDTRTLRYKADNVKDIYRDSKEINLMLFPDPPRNLSAFANQFDENGNFFIRNSDGQDEKIDADYMNVLFTLKATAPSEKGAAYVIGRFNNYTLSEDNKLIYDPTNKQFYNNLILKQGLYDYEYVWFDQTKNTLETNPFEGDFFQTENTYQIFVYYHRPGARWDTLVGYTNISNNPNNGRR